MTVLNAGSVGADLAAIGVGRLVHDLLPRAAEMIAIDPASGSSTARRIRPDEPAR